MENITWKIKLSNGKLKFENGNLLSSLVLTNIPSCASYILNVFKTIFHFPFSIFNCSLLLFFFLFFIQSGLAYEDCIITTDGKMSDIKIQQNDIIDIFPLVTIMNDKNTIIVHPLKTGKTDFFVTKDDKDEFFFNVKITKEKTTINEVDGFEILTIDCPPIEEYFELDEPPAEFDIDEPPILNERSKKEND